MVYTFKTSCIECPTLPYDDGVTTIFLYTKGTKGNPSQALANMLHYIENTNEKNAVNSALKDIHHGVNRIKSDGEVGVRYMKSWEIEEIARQEGHKAGVIDVAKNLLDILDPATIAQKTGLSEEEVLTLAKNK